MSLASLAAFCQQEVMADTNSDYWAPENMAKRQCASVHLHFEPRIGNHTAAYQEMVVEKSAPGTYFACNNFGSGYIGVQELGHKDEKGKHRRQGQVVGEQHNVHFFKPFHLGSGDFTRIFFDKF